ncbi:MAG: PAS domain S-box protein, partial [Planctomycetota bacterium]
MEILNDRFEILRPLGEGRHARVMLALDRRRSRTVAVKIFHAGMFGLDSEQAAWREFDILRPLRHPGLVRVLACEVDLATRHPYIVQELAQGEPLTAALAGRPLADIIAAVVSLCRVLDYLQARSLVHGDLHSRNVLVAQPDRVTLLDPLLPPPHRPGERRPVIGTLGYQAPEILSRENADGRADLYALGVLLYELLSGHHPFPGRDPVAVLAQQLRGEPAPLTPRSRSTPSTLAEITKRLLARDPEARYQRASDVILAINAAVGRTFPVESEDTRTAYVSDPPLVGREAELTTIRATLRSAGRRDARGGPATPTGLLIAGPLGIGKTRLQDEAIREAATLGYRIFHAAEPIDDPVIGPFAGWLRQIQSRRPERLIPFPRLRTYLAGVRMTETPPVTAAPRARLAAEALAVLARTCDEEACLWRLPDLEELPEPAFDLVVRLVASVDRPRAPLFVACCDEEELAAERRERLRRLEEENLVRVVRPRPLDEPSVVRLLHGLFEPAAWSEDLARALIRATDGNVSGILEGLQALLEEGAIVRERGTWELAHPVTALPIPEGLWKAVARRTHLLPSPERALIECLAVLDRTASPPALAALANVDAPKAQVALAKLLERGFTREHPPDEVALAPHVAGVVLAEIPASRRQEIHARALSLLQGEGRTPLVELARHAVGARSDDAIRRHVRPAIQQAVTSLDYETALELSRAAEEAIIDRAERAELLLEKGRLEAAAGWTRDAVQSFEHASLAATASGQESSHALALLGLARAVLELGDLQRAVTVVSQATEACRAVGDPLAHAQLLEPLARLLIDQGSLADARGSLASSLRQLRHPENSGQAAVAKASLRVQLARLHAADGRLKRAARVLARALSSLEQAGDPESLTAARLGQAALWLQLGLLDQAEKLLLSLAAQAEPATSRAYSSRVYQLLGVLYASRGETEQARGWLERARTLAIASGNKLREADAEHGLGIVRSAGLRHAEALQHFERAFQLHAELGRPAAQATLLLHIGDCLRTLSRYETALESYDRAIALAGASAATRARIGALQGRAQVHRSLGLLDEAEAELTESLELLAGREETGPRIVAHTELGWLQLHRGAYAYSLAAFGEALALGAGTPADNAELQALAGTAEVALQRGERYRAATLSRHLLEAAKSPGRMAALARAHLLMAEALRGPPTPPTLESHLTDAVLLAESCGDRELYREIAYRAARLREETGQLSESLELYEQAAAIATETERAFTSPRLRSRYRRSHERDRASRAARMLRTRLSRQTGSPDAAGLSGDVLLARLADLTQCQTVDALLAQAATVLLEVTSMPLGFGLLITEGTPARLVGVGAAEGETLGSSRMEGVLSVARRALVTGEILVCADVAGTTEYRELLARTTHPLRSFVCMPLHASSRPGELVGLLFSGDPEPLTLQRLPSTRRLATVARGIAGHLASLLQLGTLEKDHTLLSAERHTLAVLRRSAEALGGPGGLEERVQAALAVVLESTAAERLAIVDVARSPAQVRWQRAREPRSREAHLRVSQGVIDMMLAAGRSIGVEEARTTPPFSNFESIEDLEVRAVVVSPVKAGSEVLAAVYADQGLGDLPHGRLSESVDFLESFAQQVGSTLVREKLDAELTRSRRQTETIFDSAPYPMAAVDPEFIFRAWNDAAERVLGYSKGEIVGVRTFESLLAPRHGPEFRARLLARLRQAGAIEEELWLHRADGQDFLAAVTARAMPAASGELLGYTGILRDLTLERNAQAAIQRSEHIMRQLSDGVLIVDGHEKISYANPAAEKLFGYEPGELAGKRLEVLWPGPVRDRPHWSLAVRLGEPPARVEGLGRRKNGSLVPVSLGVSSLRDEEGEILGSVLIVADISVHKRHEDELRRLSERIITAQEEERRRLARELHDESGQVLAALRINLELLGTLITPRQKAMGELLGRSLEIVDQTQAEFRRLAADLHPAVLESFGLIPALRRYVLGLSRADALDVRIDVEGDALVPPGRSATALYRIAQEALTNVVRHAQARHARIRLRRQGNRVRLVVADDGSGFDAGALARRSGIGIIGMRERAGALGGRVRLRSALGHGTVVRASLRLSPEEAAAAEPFERSATGQGDPAPARRGELKEPRAAEPHPSEPAAEPHPSEPAAEPHPSEPAAEPHPSEPAAEPHPSEPAAEPHPSEEFF